MRPVGEVLQPAKTAVANTAIINFFILVLQILSAIEANIAKHCLILYENEQSPTQLLSFS
ncbi:hypothetical protein GCM10008027_10100 [Pseudoalteromonas gelatinilytica]|uniref:Uncharacterized protein n=1 Tax=Pseudoalteromonas gelatinilytica TaxID=1703256 RepID=A0ABQ1T8U2_9GAMM|nr:hypothetical protein GCM10008027_10100 [Pseudoalteromonas profundi]